MKLMEKQHHKNTRSGKHLCDACRSVCDSERFNRKRRRPDMWDFERRVTESLKRAKRHISNMFKQHVLWAMQDSVERSRYVRRRASGRRPHHTRRGSRISGRVHHRDRRQREKPTQRRVRHHKSDALEEPERKDESTEIKPVNSDQQSKFSHESEKSTSSIKKCETDDKVVRTSKQQAVANKKKRQIIQKNQSFFMDSRSKNKNHQRKFANSGVRHMDNEVIVIHDDNSNQNLDLTKRKKSMRSGDNVSKTPDKSPGSSATSLEPQSAQNSKDSKTSNSQKSIGTETVFDKPTSQQ
ncbi:uncharacterized protein LOC113385731 [Ctenocephalides felis]|uniref:uncharacterized protein LOC113385731 n=1 Tax=Ctenocephalides felis TaxID=7515 RepID=UPI000E6E139A|nr:uncharacterized protein LOC113385731 [Ctenocephalides felis]